MRTIKYSNTFKKDYRKIKATPRYRTDIDDLLGDVLNLLIADKALPPNNKAPFGR